MAEPQGAEAVMLLKSALLTALALLLVERYLHTPSKPPYDWLTQCRKDGLV